MHDSLGRTLSVGDHIFTLRYGVCVSPRIFKIPGRVMNILLAILSIERVVALVIIGSPFTKNSLRSFSFALGRKWQRRLTKSRMLTI